MSDKKYMKRFLLALCVFNVGLTFYTLFVAKVAEFKAQSLEHRVNLLEDTMGTMSRRGVPAHVGNGVK